MAFVGEKLSQDEIFVLFEFAANDFEDVYRKIKKDCDIAEAARDLSKACEPFVEIIGRAYNADVEYKQIDEFSPSEVREWIKNFQNDVKYDIRAMRNPHSSEKGKLCVVMNRAYQAYTSTIEVFHKWKKYGNGSFNGVYFPIEMRTL
jgi:hypothetical protein